jgi:hypothetical protein
VREALTRRRTEVWMRQVSDYLQGSYRNATSIYRDTDVDLVLEWTGVCNYDFSALGFNDQIRARVALSIPPPYQFPQFRADVLDTLQREFGWANVDASGSKAIQVAAEPGVRLTADIVPCVQYRKYTSWNGRLDQNYVEGMTFWTSRGEQVINFPKMHIQRGWDKNSNTNDLYKPTVRIYKNARNAAVGRGILTEGTAPSYFIECLLSNVPNDDFAYDNQYSFLRSLVWLNGQRYAGRLGNFWSQNGVVPLFGNSAQQWDIESAEQLIAALFYLYENW